MLHFCNHRAKFNLELKLQVPARPNTVNNNMLFTDTSLHLHQLTLQVCEPVGFSIFQGKAVKDAGGVGMIVLPVSDVYTSSLKLLFTICMLRRCG